MFVKLFILILIKKKIKIVIRNKIPNRISLDFEWNEIKKKDKNIGISFLYVISLFFGFYLIISIFFNSIIDNKKIVE